MMREFLKVDCEGWGKNKQEGFKMPLVLCCLCVCLHFYISHAFTHNLNTISPLAKRVGVRKTKLREWTNWEIKSAVEFLVDCVLLQQKCFFCVFRIMLYLQCLICCTCVCVFDIKSINIDFFFILKYLNSFNYCFNHSAFSEQKKSCPKLEIILTQKVAPNLFLLWNFGKIWEQWFATSKESER